MDRYGQGARVAVLFDPATGLPDRAVLGDVVLVYANWDSAAGTVDVARTYGPTGWIDVARRVPIPGAKAATQARPGAVESALSCFPACPTDLQNLSEMLKVAGVGLSVVSCMTATAATFGALLVPCGGALVSAASLALPDDPWLGDVNQVGRILALGDALKCTRGSVADCVSFFNSVATEAIDLVDATLKEQEEVITAAAFVLASPAGPSGLIQGTPPACAGAYECTPGAYLPCLDGGTRKCGTDCRWPDCPRPDSPAAVDVIASDDTSEEGVERFDGAWTMEFSFGPCGPTDDLPRSGSITISNGVFAPGPLFSYDAHGTLETVTLLSGAVDERGSLEGFFSLSGEGCRDEKSHYYGYLTSTTAGYATSYWGSIKFRR